MILVTGFGPFPGVPENPSARLASALNGRRVHGTTVLSRVLPVSYARGPAQAIASARHLHAELVLGLGVSPHPRPKVERLGRRQSGPTPDVDEDLAPDWPEGFDTVEATLDVDTLADAVGAEVSEDAGHYVCNAWLSLVTLALEVPVGFLHIPPRGLEPERVLAGLAALTESGGSAVG